MASAESFCLSSNLQPFDDSVLMGEGYSKQLLRNEQKEIERLDAQLKNVTAKERAIASRGNRYELPYFNLKSVNYPV